MGFSDERLATLAGLDAERGRGASAGRSTCTRSISASIRARRSSRRRRPICTRPMRRLSRANQRREARPTDKEKIIILGGGPNRIGQGIEFDYCCCHAAFALTAAGFETIMVNCNPETVSTDYDTSDRLYFEPLTEEDVIEIVRVELSKGNVKGVIVQFGGQTPLKLAEGLARANVPIIGTSPDAIDLAEDRDRFKALIDKVGLTQPRSGIARSAKEAHAIAAEIGFPVVIRPSYVLGGRAMEIVHDETQLARYIAEAVVVSGKSPVLDRLLFARRHRGRCRCAVRRQGCLHLRRDGAYRGGRRSFRRLGLLAAAAFAEISHRRRDGAADRGARARAQCRRPDERAIRDPERRDLCAGGEPARLAHRALRRQGDRLADRQASRQR